MFDWAFLYSSHKQNCKASISDVLAQKFAKEIDRLSGQAGDRLRDPESKNFKGIWIPASAGMTAGRGQLMSNFWVNSPVPRCKTSALHAHFSLLLTSCFAEFATFDVRDSV